MRRSPRPHLSMQAATNLAVSAGWKDDSAWTRRSVREQHSLQRDGYLGCVVVPDNGPVTWRVQHLNKDGNSRYGTAPSTSSAKQACERALADLTATLF